MMKWWKDRQDRKRLKAFREMLGLGDDVTDEQIIAGCAALSNACAKFNPSARTTAAALELFGRHAGIGFIEFMSAQKDIRNTLQ